MASFIRGILAAVGGYNDLRTRSLGSEDSGESGSSTKLKSQSSAGPLMALLAFEALLLMLYVADESCCIDYTVQVCGGATHTIHTDEMAFFIFNFITFIFTAPLRPDTVTHTVGVCTPYTHTHTFHP